MVANNQFKLEFKIIEYIAQIEINVIAAINY